MLFIVPPAAFPAGRVGGVFGSPIVPGEMMRRLAVLAGVSAVFFALVALALASPTPTVTYNSPIKQTGKPKPGKPAPVQYDGILDVKNPDGTQPATVPRRRCTSPSNWSITGSTSRHAASPT